MRSRDRPFKPKELCYGVRYVEPEPEDNYSYDKWDGKYDWSDFSPSDP